MALNDVTPLPCFDCNCDVTSVALGGNAGKPLNIMSRVRALTIPDKKALLLHSAGMDVEDMYETLYPIGFLPAFEGEVDDVYNSDWSSNLSDFHLSEEITILLQSPEILCLQLIYGI